MKKKKELVMHIPREIATSLSRRHFGREDLTRNEILDAVSKMNILFSLWEKADSHLTWIYDVFWEEEKIESHYGSPKFYGAHRRLQNAQKKVKELHKQMFYLMVHTDGNYEPFGSDAMGARSIHADFSEKYLKRI
jgi:hypothetical protein